MARLGISDIWQGIVQSLQGRIGVLFALAAPFTLLVDMGLRIFGPEAPKSADDITPATLLWLVVLPSLVGSIGQMIVAQSLLEPAQPPRAALASALSAWPAYMAALLLSALPTGLATLMFVLPGLYVTGRLFLLMPLALTRKTGAVALLRESWQRTRPAGWPIFGFLIVAILAILGLSLLAGGVGAALGSVFNLFGMAAVGDFVAGLVPAIAATLVAIGSAALACELHRRLA